MQYNHEMMWKELKEKLYPRADKDGLLSTADLDEVMEELENEWQKLVNVKSVDLPQAPETTEILNEVKADKGILTEEELKERNRLLVLENDELNAENQKYKKGLFDTYDFIFSELAIPKHYREKFYRILLIDCKLDPNIRKLEELK